MARFSLGAQETGVYMRLMTVEKGRRHGRPRHARRMVKDIRIGKWRIPLPRSRMGRILVGVLLIIGGVFGFLPVLGFWMIPLGLAVLSYDIPAVRRWRRAFVVRTNRWLARRYPPLARRLGIPEDPGADVMARRRRRRMKETRMAGTCTPARRNERVS